MTEGELALAVCFVLAIITLFCHLKKEDHSPIILKRTTFNFELKTNASFDLEKYQIFFAIKWLCIGAILTILALYGWETV